MSVSDISLMSEAQCILRTAMTATQQRRDAPATEVGSSAATSEAQAAADEAAAEAAAVSSAVQHPGLVAVKASALPVLEIIGFSRAKKHSKEGDKYYVHTSSAAAAAELACLGPLYISDGARVLCIDSLKTANPEGMRYAVLYRTPSSGMAIHALIRGKGLPRRLNAAADTRHARRVAPRALIHNNACRTCPHRVLRDPHACDTPRSYSLCALLAPLAHPLPTPPDVLHAAVVSDTSLLALRDLLVELCTAEAQAQAAAAGARKKEPLPEPEQVYHAATMGITSRVAQTSVNQCYTAKFLFTEGNHASWFLGVFITDAPG